MLPQITIEKHLNIFVQVCNLPVLTQTDVKNACKNIVLFTDRGVFHNYVHIRKQLF